VVEGLRHRDPYRPIPFQGHMLPRVFLRVFSTLYRFCLEARRLAYEKGVFAPKKAPCFVLSVGNLSLGGSGKTPTTMLLAQWAADRGLKVAVISRGYKGSKSSKRPVIVSDGKRLNLGPQEVGDEPYMMAKNLEGIPVIICKDRFNACMVAKEFLQVEVVLLDDGFQHLALYRDLDLLVVRPHTFQDELFPLGNLREPIHNIVRADVLLVVLDHREPIDSLQITSLFKGPIFFARQLPYKVYLPKKGVELDPSFLEGKDLIAFSGIAGPERFLNTLLHLKANVVRFHAFKDHHPFKEREVKEIRSQLKKGVHLITTEKDWARLEGLSHLFGQELMVLLTRIEVDRSQEFFGFMEKALLGATEDGRSTL
jgi:tetraacyldisaccharide 4'-kinase